jgi:drug/metabolite transporter (DMT)-like permease
MNFITASALVLPIITGLCGAFWALLVSSGPGGMWLTIGGNVISQVVLLTILWIAGVEFPKFNAGISLAFFVFIVTSAIISVLWLYPYLKGMPYAVLSITEVAWPIFALIFGWMLLGGAQLNTWQMAGGALVICGSLLVVSAGGS